MSHGTGSQRLTSQSQSHHITSRLPQPFWLKLCSIAQRHLLLGLPFRPSTTSHGDDMSSVPRVAFGTRVESSSENDA